MTGGRRRQGDLKLLLAEVIQEIRLLRGCLLNPDAPAERARAHEELKHKAAYIAALAMAGRNSNFDLAAAEKNDEKKTRLFRGLASISSRLHRISDISLNILRQFGHLQAPGFLLDYGLDDFFEEISDGLAGVGPALEQEKLDLAVRCARIEENLDAHYADRFARIMRELEGGGRPGDLITTLMIVHYLERVGDIVMEIGEDLMFVILGEKLRFSQYRALTAGLAAAGRGGHFEAGDFQSIWSGRSGCRIGVVGAPGQAGAPDGEPVVFKHGPAGKMEKERDNLELWGRQWPGLAPELRAFVAAEAGGEASVVLEFIPGPTLRDLFMSHAAARAEEKLAGSLELMAGLWRETRTLRPAAASFARQAEKRLGSVRALHPHPINFEGALGRLKIFSIPELLAAAASLEEGLAAPFSVRIHGDFNLSNIICGLDGAFHFLDLYRSCLSDYVQDLSVMMLSILRLPLSAAADRTRLAAAAGLVWDYAEKFAAENGDETVAARLAFGLARSYLTSARFEARRGAAAQFIAYSRYIWEKLIAHRSSGRPWPDFRLDKKALYL
ncbi:MAG: phosphotransferase [Candidatus Adiutrix sp.]|jgi:phosphate uptake regulator|nr:phosphotransferase [Candidatus Adiutrix sp.]